MGVQSLGRGIPYTPESLLIRHWMELHRDEGTGDGDRDTADAVDEGDGDGVDNG
jgi:hypothetical protein